jgi:polar amino acid transport system permease protein
MRPSDLPIAKRIPWITLVAVPVIFLIAFAVFNSLARNTTLQWDLVGKFLFNAQIIDGVKVTLQLTILSVIFASLIGFILALTWRSRSWVLSSLTWFYIWIFRGTPILVQLLFWFNISLVLPQITLWLPFLGTMSWQTNDLISGYTAALLALVFHEAAYMAEIFRGGFLAVPRGQVEAALSLGMTHNTALVRIVLPQSLRAIIPPTVNQLISLLKMTSLVSVIGGGELLTRAQFIYGSNFAVIPLLIVVSVWYLAIVTIATIAQWFIERHIGGATSSALSKS